MLLSRNLSPSKLNPRLLSSTVSPFLKPHFSQPLPPQTPNQNHPFSSSVPKKTISKLVLEGTYDETVSCTVLICPGCGVKMQQYNPKLPGYFLRPRSKDPLFTALIKQQQQPAVGQTSDSFKRGLLKEGQRKTNSPLISKPPAFCISCHSYWSGFVL